MKKNFTTPLLFSAFRKNSFIGMATGLMLVFHAHSQDTFSIVAVDPETGEVGSAGASCIGYPTIPNGAIIISDVHPGVGAIHTQAYYIASNQNYAKALMDSGHSPQQIIDSVVANDIQNNPLIRQYGVVDFTGAAAYTGSNCDDYKNHIIGSTYAIQGNILLGQQILDSIEARFLNTEGNMACKLMASLQGAKVPGADTRCLDEGISTLSAFLRVGKSTDTPEALSIDLNVKSVPDTWVIDPIDSLQKLFDETVNCTGVGVASFQKAEQSVQLIPNPAIDQVLLTSDSPFRKVEMYDLLGRKIWESEFVNTMQTKITWEKAPGNLVVLKILFSDNRSCVTMLELQNH